MDSEFGVDVISESLCTEAGALGDGVVGVVESAAEGDIRLEICVQIAHASAAKRHYEAEGVAAQEYFVAIFGLADDIEIGAEIALDDITLSHG